MKIISHLNIITLACISVLTTGSVAAAIPNTIPNLSMVEHASPDLDSLKNNIITDSSFVNSLFYLGHHLGYAWAGGTQSRYVGEDIAIRRESENKYSLNARYNASDPYADGYRASERLKVKLNNIRFVTNPKDLTLGEPQVYDREVLYTETHVYYNWGDLEDTAVASLNYNQQSSWSKTDNFSFSQTIGVTNKYEVGIPGIGGASSEIKAEFSASQGWNESNGNSTTLAGSAQYRAIMEPRSKRYVTITLFKQKADIPYNSKVFMLYDINYENFLRWSGNSHIDHPTNRPNFPYTFGGANAKNLSGPEALVDQYLHQDINGYGEWDWPSAVQSSKSKYWFEWNLANLSRKHGASIAGKFTTVDASQFNVDASESIPLTAEDYANRKSKNKATRTRRSASFSQIEMVIENIENNDPDGIISGLNISQPTDMMMSN
ncbi:aerolysin family beta-barrel pore-forming toxin [Moritella viscosa]|uniref:Aerolysin/hemolysin/leukocidin toxin n=1 Tax=Moritella viscosa TaxID=80854 RepID=W6AN90_9GAMM|nr:aerolysin family beta-barrel pore-forming toxin [Moritella viscosa]AHI58922.1 putative aerolysin [Moritella viscosa]SGY83844.1 Aerolysin/hemolysin/leukocidin toxin [Moritella viscosa]SGY85467.1 Aerolysin/hemolysin/leukocidin toxin [Moritella viscosa]SHO24474.1 Aerolysin/hemolysin/leukocidin toxin [Moritella viscosa]